MSVVKYQMLIDGAWVDAADGACFDREYSETGSQSYGKSRGFQQIL